MTEKYIQYGYNNVPSDDFGRILKDNFHHFVELQEILKTSYNEWRGCGSYLMDGTNLQYDINSHPKQVNLYSLSLDKYNAFEIGVHGGHSLLIMLLANPKMKIQCVDICEYSHVEKCIDYLNKSFNNQISFIKGSSRDVLSKVDVSNFNKLEIAHIDGNHCMYAIQSELAFIENNINHQIYIVFDDYDSSNIPNIIRTNDKLEIINVPNCPHRNCITKYNPSNS
jgi:hypothetical protein